MKLGDFVMFIHRDGLPRLGQIVAFTPKRVRVMYRHGVGYCTSLRAEHKLALAMKGKTLC